MSITAVFRTTIVPEPHERLAAWDARLGQWRAKQRMCEASIHQIEDARQARDAIAANEDKP